MVRSRNFGPARHSAASCAASRTMGPPILRDGRYATIAFLGSACTCALLRMRRINAQHLVSRFISSEIPVVRLFADLALLHAIVLERLVDGWPLQEPNQSERRFGFRSV